MKNKIFMYLFFFTALLLLFQFKNSTNILNSYEEDIKKLKSDHEALMEEYDKLLIDNLDLQYFSLETNDEALDYFEDRNVDLNTLPQYIEDKLLETNTVKGDNPLVPYEGMEGDMKINKIKLLNHKWIIADYSDGKYWGELFLTYELKEDLGVDFTLKEYLLYMD